MITFSPSYGVHSRLHWHDGCTCHGAPTLKECLTIAKENKWVGKVLKRIDNDINGHPRPCYTLVVSHFSHWRQFGKFVATVEIQVRLYK